MSAEWRRRQLGEFLRGRRERLQPADVGMPAGQRRRVVGLRREEVAVLAHLSVTWYTYLEQGRDVRPSDEVLDNLVRVLRLTEDEARYLHLLAHGGSRLEPLLSDRPTPDDLEPRFMTMMADRPEPVYACDHYFGLTAWNAAAADWYGGWTAPTVDEPNYMDWMLFNPDAKRRLVHWTEEVQDVLARWRSHIARRAVDDRVNGQVARYRAHSPEFAAGGTSSASWSTVRASVSCVIRCTASGTSRSCRWCRRTFPAASSCTSRSTFRPRRSTPRVRTPTRTPAASRRPPGPPARAPARRTARSPPAPGTRGPRGPER